MSRPAKTARRSTRSPKPTPIRFAPHVVLTDPLRAEDRGAFVEIVVNEFEMAVGERRVLLNMGSIDISGTRSVYETLYYVYFDHPHGGWHRHESGLDAVVAYQASRGKVAAGYGGRYFVGSILTPKRGGAPTVGNGDGGTEPRKSISPTKEEPKNRIGLNIMRCCKERGWSLEELAGKTEPPLAKNTVIALKKGTTRRPHPSTLERIAKACGFTVADLEK